MHNRGVAVRGIMFIESMLKLFYVLLTVHRIIMIVFFFCQLDAQILYFNTFILFFYMFRALLCLSSEGQIVLVQHLVSSLSLGDCSVRRLREDESPPVTCVMNSHLKRVTIPDAVLTQFVLLKMGIIVLETCGRIQ